MATLSGGRIATVALLVGMPCLFSACSGDAADGAGGADAASESALTAGGGVQTRTIELWAEGTPAFGIFVPSERPRGETAPDGARLPALYTKDGAALLAQNELLDYLFLNLEQSYDADAVRAMAEGLEQENSSVTLLVRIPPISTDGADAARSRVIEAFDLGADGVVLPHVRSVEEARLAVTFFADAGVDVWTPQNPEGNKLAFLMIEDPDALAEAQAIADVPGYSVLACGIGSLTRALGGDREAGEAGNQEVLAQAKRVGLPDVITANADDVAQRISEGFLGLLMSGPGADEAIRIGRRAAGR